MGGGGGGGEGVAVDLWRSTLIYISTSLIVPGREIAGNCGRVMPYKSTI